MFRAWFSRRLEVNVELSESGGGGNRTRVRGRTVKNLYKLVLRLDFARRLDRRRPTDGLAIP